MAGVIFGDVGSSYFGGSFAPNANSKLRGRSKTTFHACANIHWHMSLQALFFGCLWSVTFPGRPTSTVQIFLTISRNDASRGLNLLHLLYGFACRHDSYASLSKVQKAQGFFQCCTTSLTLSLLWEDVCIHNVYTHVSKSFARMM